MAAAIPVALSAAHLFAGLKGAGAANKMSPMQQETFKGQSELAKEQSGLARVMGQRFTLSGPGYSKAMDYYTRALGGGRAGIDAALQPETSRIADVYRGGATRIQNNMRGPQKEQAMGELARQHAGQLSGMRSGVRENAAQILGQMGSPGQGGPAAAAFGSAGGAYNDLAQILSQRQRDVGQSYSQMGMDWAKMWIPYFMDKGKGGKQGDR